MLFQTDKEKIIQEHKNQNKTNLIQENQTNLKKTKNCITDNFTRQFHET